MTLYPGRPGRYCSRACYQAKRAGQLRKTDVKHRMRRAPGHPVAPASGIVAIARINLYDRIGPGEHACNWCGTTVEWMPGAGLAPRALIVDHLNLDPTDDRPENLVPSCSVCNAGRTRMYGPNKNIIGPEEPWVRMASGRRGRAQWNECEWCGEPFLVAIAQVKIGRGRYCSVDCRWTRKDRAASSRDRVRKGG